MNVSIPRRDDAVLFGLPAPSCSAGTSATAAMTCSRWPSRLDGLVTITHSNGKGLVEASALGVTKATVVAELAAGAGIGRNR